MSRPPKARWPAWAIVLLLLAGCCARGDRWLGDSLTEQQADLATESGLDEGVLEIALTALDPAVAQDVIDVIRGGTLLVAYFPDEVWLEGSAFLDVELD